MPAIQSPQNPLNPARWLHFASRASASESIALFPPSHPIASESSDRPVESGNLKG
ncbi:hypothetical protein QUB70_23510 [Microcoleus sp. A003_D6]|uniref:hypothetical protein n=1 Tax=Microcoleus sp. A003_D6 TaxID=3055266 RepID=UPI002FD5C9B4